MAIGTLLTRDIKTKSATGVFTSAKILDMRRTVTSVHVKIDKNILWKEKVDSVQSLIQMGIGMHSLFMKIACLIKFEWTGSRNRVSESSTLSQNLVLLTPPNTIMFIQKNGFA